MIYFLFVFCRPISPEFQIVGDIVAFEIFFLIYVGLSLGIELDIFSGGSVQYFLITALSPTREKLCHDLCRK
jgi:hypothetical protein